MSREKFYHKKVHLKAEHHISWCVQRAVFRTKRMNTNAMMQLRLMGQENQMTYSFLLLAFVPLYWMHIHTVYWMQRKPFEKMRLKVRFTCCRSKINDNFSHKSHMKWPHWLTSERTVKAWSLSNSTRCDSKHEAVKGWFNSARWSSSSWVALVFRSSVVPKNV